MNLLWNTCEVFRRNLENGQECRIWTLRNKDQSRLQVLPGEQSCFSHRSETEELPLLRGTDLPSPEAPLPPSPGSRTLWVLTLRLCCSFPCACSPAPLRANSESQGIIRLAQTGSFLHHLLYRKTKTEMDQQTSVLKCLQTLPSTRPHNCGELRYISHSRVGT